MKFHRLALLATCTMLAIAPAAARRALVTVDARAMPWEPSVNPKRAFGQGDGEKPVYVFGLRLVPESRLLFTASGIVTVVPNTPQPTPNGGAFRGPADMPVPAGGYPQTFPTIGDGMGRQSTKIGAGPSAQVGSWGPTGQPFRPASGSIGALGTVFPSYYMPHKAYPVRVNALLGAFVDADGKVVGDPFAIGERIIVTVPYGATGIALGVNAESFAFNRGAFNVIINTRTPTVTVEDVPSDPPIP